MHAVLRIAPGAGGDWIVEGLAELYSLELLRALEDAVEEALRARARRIAERGAA